MPWFKAEPTYGSRPMTRREDADGAVHVYARAHASLTAGYGYLVANSYLGYVTAAVFDTGLATTSTTYALHGSQYYFGIVKNQIPSDTDGWIQIQGYCPSAVLASQAIVAGNQLMWIDATITGTGTPTTTGLQLCVVGFGMNTTSSGSFDIYLIGTPVLGYT